jgi:hypothetical protein
LVPLLHTSEPTVNGAFSRARELGYLTVVAEHKRGTKRGDTFHLSMPADAVKATQIPLVTSDELTQIPLVTGPKNLGSPDQNSFGPTRDLTCDNESPSGLKRTGLTNPGLTNPPNPQPLETPAVPAVLDPAPRKRGTRLPEGWMPDQCVINAMRLECPNVNLEAEHRKFSDHWLAAAGQRGVKADWNATWRNWLRTANERLGGQCGSHPRQSTSDASAAAAQALKRPNPELTNPTRLDLLS